MILTSRVSEKPAFLIGISCCIVPENPTFAWNFFRGWLPREFSLTKGINPAIISETDIPISDIPKNDIKVTEHGI